MISGNLQMVSNIFTGAGRVKIAKQNAAKKVLIRRFNYEFYPTD